ncbi:hypothetical protein N7492_010256 [Penicillium capsulatum]|uniref:Rhodopsin domain-containing protein n=1 Tax=Penicillium capsulatum TaxID=69766 RepID=A0A9W9HM01_9EURO|nr:hypothetical protein N7492_010256 [Penicillium capsulatum]
MGTRFKGDTRDPAVNVTNLVLLVVFVLSIFVRLGTKYRLFRRFTNDDYFMLVSMVFGVVQSIAVSMAVANGFGKHFHEVSDDEFMRTEKWLYTATLLYIVGICFSKLSIASFIRNLSPSSRDRFLARIAEAVTSVWAVVAFIGTAFQCSVPNTWDLYYGKCLNQTAWIYFVGVTNIVTDLLILSQGLHLIHQVQTSLKKRLIFASIFLPRTLVVLGIIAEMALVRRGTHTSDPTYDFCQVVIAQQIIQCVSIVTACWGQLKPFLTWLRSNGLRIQDAEFATGYATKSFTASQSQTGSGERRTRNSQEGFGLAQRNQILVTQDWEVGSQSSRAPVIQDHDPWVEATGARQSPELRL